MDTIRVPVTVDVPEAVYEEAEKRAEDSPHDTEEFLMESVEVDFNFNIAEK